MNRHAYIEKADRRIPNPEQYLGFWISDAAQSWFWVQEVIGVKGNGIAQGLTKRLSKGGWASHYHAPLFTLTSKFRKSPEPPNELSWLIQSVNNTI